MVKPPYLNSKYFLPNWCKPHVRIPMTFRSQYPLNGGFRTGTPTDKAVNCQTTPCAGGGATPPPPPQRNLWLIPPIQIIQLGNSGSYLHQYLEVDLLALYLKPPSLLQFMLVQNCAHDVLILRPQFQIRWEYLS